MAFLYVREGVMGMSIEGGEGGDVTNAGRTDKQGKIKMPTFAFGRFF